MLKRRKLEKEMEEGKACRKRRRWKGKHEKEEEM